MRMRSLSVQRSLHLIVAGIIALFPVSLAKAFPVGERHLLATEASAKLRDAQHRDQLRITVWYPAAGDGPELPLDIGPVGHPLFKPGSAAPDAGFADAVRRPVVLLSHGFGGTARIMAWFGTALARAGYIVIAVDHPGNNGRDRMTVEGAVMFWERPGDLTAALKRVEEESSISSHMDLARLGVAGFSAGGFTSIAASGVHVDPLRFVAFCKTHPQDGVCRPQQEFQVTRDQGEALLARPEVVAEMQHVTKDIAVPGVRAVFAMAPAIVQSFDPASLSRVTVPVHIVLGDADVVAPPPTNGEVAAHAIPGAQMEVLHGVGHYDFLSQCTADGQASLPICRTTVPQAETHATVIRSALAFFDKTLGTH